MSLFASKSGLGTKISFETWSVNSSDLFKMLSLYEPYDDSDLLSRDRLSTFINSNTNCFERSNLAGHLTGSCWLLNQASDSVLLSHHKKLNIWVQLGGHADGDEDILQVCLKEAYEESGLKSIRVLNPTEIFDIDIHEIPDRKGVPTHLHYDVRFVLQAVDSDSFEISDESNDLKWVKISELQNYSTEWSIMRMREKWLKISES